jgi:hypothetical protein
MSDKHHDQGQTDFSNGKFDPPHGIADDLTTWRSSEVHRHYAENQDYRDGWNHAKSQSK